MMYLTLHLQLIQGLYNLAMVPQTEQTKSNKLRAQCCTQCMHAHCDCNSIYILSNLQLKLNEKHRSSINAE